MRWTLHTVFVASLQTTIMSDQNGPGRPAGIFREVVVVIKFSSTYV